MKPRRVDRLESSFFLFELTEHGVSTNPDYPRGIPDPTGIEAHVNNRRSIYGSL
jgi:hypothetical protein